MTSCVPLPTRIGLSDLRITHGRKQRLHRLTEQAEASFVRQVVRDGGVAGWRGQIEHRVRRARVSCGAGRLARTDTATLVVALLDQPVRDLCCHLVDVDPDPAWVPLWLHLARHAPPPYRAEPLFLLAWTAWRLDDPRLARTALGAARAEDPDHRAAILLGRLLASGLPSSEVSPVPRPGGVR